MNHTISIIDTQDATVTQVETARDKSIVLQWHGGDEKTPAVVGSSLFFTMRAPSLSEGHFLDFFTGDENRYRVELTSDDDGSMIWQGFLLPDSYSEPYSRSNIFVGFEATCGLGRLKGKYLPDAYYIEEKTVIDIISSLLALTGLQLDMYFSPAIENYIEKDYTNIYIDAITFLEGEKKKDAYTILEQLVINDMLCVVFQAENAWHIEGINKRHLRTYMASRYDHTGAFIAQIEISQNVKQITALATPEVTMIPPFNRITVSHKREAPALPDIISQEDNPGWVVTTGVIGEVYASAWRGNGGFYAKVTAPNYRVRLYNSGNAAFNITNFASLREKIYVRPGEKYRFKAAFSIVFSGGESAAIIENIIDGGHWDDPQQYDVRLNDTILFSNNSGDVTEEETLSFDPQKKTSANFEFIIEQEGLLDIRLYQPFGLINDNRIEAVEITDMKLEAIGFEKEYAAEDEINGEYTIDEEVELNYADDPSGFSPGFRLSRLKQADLSYNSISVPVLYGFAQNGANYAVVQLEGAKLIKDNIGTVYYNAVLLTDLEMIYNYQVGEQMVVNTGPDVIDSGSFDLRVYLIEDYTDSREDWLKWGDAIYSIEQLRYGQAALNVYRRLFNEPHEKIDLVAENEVKFNDIPQFSFLGLNDYFITSCAWNLSAGTTEITMIRSRYGGTGSNIPPLVDAGDDIEIAQADDATQLTATAEDPDGSIASVLWTQLSGDPGAVIQNPNNLNTQITNLTGDAYTFQVEVTDNDGATATDTVNIIRIIDYTVSLTLISEQIVDTPEEQSNESTWQFQVSPALPPGYTLQIGGSFDMEVYKTGAPSLGSNAQQEIIKNAVVLESDSISDTDTLMQNFSLNYIDGDDIQFTGIAEVTDNDPGGPGGAFKEADASVSFTLDSVVFITGSGTILGLPDSVTISITL